MNAPGKIRYLTREQVDTVQWDHCIAGADYPAIYGFSFYLDHMAKKWSALVLDDYAAVMPLTWNKKYGLTYLYQPFCTAMLGVFGKEIDTDTVKQFLQNIPVVYRYWDISLNPSNTISDALYDARQRKNYVLSLHPAYTVLHAAFSSNIRRNIKKAMQSGLNIIHPPAAEVINLARAHLQDSKISEEDFSRFLSLYHHLEQKSAALTYGIASATGQLLSSCIFFIWEHRAYYILAGNHPDGKENGASHALINAFIADYAGTATLLDFEGSDISGLALFYKSFGATEEIYPAIKYNRLPKLIKWLKN